MTCLRDLPERNKIIYERYIRGESKESLAGDYNLTVDRIKHIILDQKSKVNKRKELLEDLRKYLESNYEGKIFITRMINAISRYMVRYNVYTVDHLKDIIYSDIYIRNIGVKSRNIMKIFLEYK